MGAVSTVNGKGQITIPKDLRDRFGIKAGDRIVFTIMPDGTVQMRAKNKSASWRGVCDGKTKSGSGQNNCRADDLAQRKFPQKRWMRSQASSRIFSDVA